MDDDGPVPISIHSALISVKNGFNNDHEHESPKPWNRIVVSVYTWKICRVIKKIILIFDYLLWYWRIRKKQINKIMSEPTES